jgi:hypothetical protein
MSSMSSPSPQERLPQIPRYERCWLDAERDPSLCVSGHDLLRLGLETGPCIGFVLHRLARAVAADPSLNEPAALLALVPTCLEDWVPPPPVRFGIKPHAVRRYMERVAPSLPYTDASLEMLALAAATPFQREAPAWMQLSERTSRRGGYLEVAEGICFAISDGSVRTVITREIVEENGGPPPDPFPGERPDRPVPTWPDRHYAVDPEGRIKCQTMVGGRLMSSTGRSSQAAWRALRKAFMEQGLRRAFEEGQRQRSQVWWGINAERAAKASGGGGSPEP